MVTEQIIPILCARHGMQSRKYRSEGGGCNPQTAGVGVEPFHGVVGRVDLLPPMSLQQFGQFLCGGSIQFSHLGEMRWEVEEGGRGGSEKGPGWHTVLQAPAIVANALAYLGTRRGASRRADDGAFLLLPGALLLPLTHFYFYNFCIYSLPSTNVQRVRYHGPEGGERRAGNGGYPLKRKGELGTMTSRNELRRLRSKPPDSPT
ncbi:hypothetical protein B0H16DRAFT_1477470 [Mycena metata]|uniref:Uncharacterized protein n=1 Tax=Mycena metata TaxID=1033252 RepID=A0AAD7MFH8_9AGAR|nr:hypothetical protein B0H16DRAFT_1477470 [Mycena metata]